MTPGQRLDCAVSDFRSALIVGDANPGEVRLGVPGAEGSLSRDYALFSFVINGRRAVVALDWPRDLAARPAVGAVLDTLACYLGEYAVREHNAARVVRLADGKFATSPPSVPVSPPGPLDVAGYRSVAEQTFAAWERGHGSAGGVVAGVYTMGSRVHLIDSVVEAMVAAAGRATAEARMEVLAEARSAILAEMTVGGMVSVEDVCDALDRVGKARVVMVREKYGVDLSGLPAGVKLSVED